MAGIRVNTGAKKIEVNDNGDYIIINFSDATFPARYLSMVESMKARSTDIENQAKELMDKSGEGTPSSLQEIANLYQNFNRGVMEDIDALFGPDTCKKVFGDVVPGLDLFNDFFTQLYPYMEKFGTEWGKKFDKYRADRTGNV